MKKWLIFFACTLLAFSCKVQKINFAWSDYKPVLAQYIDKPDSINQTSLKNCLLKVMSESMKQKKTVPPGIYMQYAFLLQTEGYFEMAKQYYELEKHNYPESAVMIDELESKPR